MTDVEDYGAMMKILEPTQITTHGSNYKDTNEQKLINTT